MNKTLYFHEKSLNWKWTNFQRANVHVIFQKTTKRFHKKTLTGSERENLLISGLSF